MTAPDYVLDIEGTEVRVGDRIAYAVRDGNAAALRVAKVRELIGYTNWRGQEETDVKVGRTSILASLKRFVKLPDAACAAGEHVHVALVDSKRDELRESDARALALADEVDQLRVELAEAERRFEHATAVANAEKQRADALRDDQEGLVDQHSLIKPREEARRLREAIKNAPHDNGQIVECESIGWIVNGQIVNLPEKCNCWKAAVS